MIRSAELADVPGIAKVESAGWPVQLAAGIDVVTARVRAFPQGQLLEYRDGDIAAVIATQRVSTSFFELAPVTFARLTDRGRITGSHDPHGDILHLIGVAVSPSLRGAGLGLTLVNAAVALGQTLPGVRRILGYTRPVGFHRHPGLSIEQYLALRDARGRPVDPVLAMHLGNGAKIVNIQPGFRPEDTEAGGFGVLIEYTHKPE